MTASMRRARTDPWPLRVRLVDSTFSNPSLTAAEETAAKDPTYIQWDRSDQPCPVTVYTDIRLAEAAEDHTSQTKIALLIEPPAVSETHYREALRLEDAFAAILTHQRDWLFSRPSNRWRWYPMGGTRLSSWWIPTQHKGRLVSLLTSAKYLTEGHRLRHEIAGMLQRVAGMLDFEIFGEPYTPYLPLKRQALGPFLYSIVVENSRSDWYFTEKLLDCLATETIPIYWGCPDIGRYFETHGIISFETPDDLGPILSRMIGPEDYERRRPYLLENKTRALEYTCAENWIVARYPDLFRGAPSWQTALWTATLENGNNENQPH